MEFEPALIRAHVNLGWALAVRQHFVEATTQCERTREIAPDFVDSEFKWGLSLAMQGKLRGALPHLFRAVEL